MCHGQACTAFSHDVPLTQNSAQAGIFEPPPTDEEAVATPLGLMLNCINSGLYMANYNLVRTIPPATMPPPMSARGRPKVFLVRSYCSRRI